MSINLPSVTISEFVQIVKMQYEENNYRPIFGLGKGGIGKTEAIKDLATELGIGYVDIRLLLYAETDLKGIPYPDETHTKTIWLQNDILPTVEQNGEKGILVFDEITSCARSVRTAAYQLLNERRLGEYKLPDGWMIVCLGNGEEDGGDYQGMEGNFVNRCSVFNVTTSVEAWKSWARNHNVNSLVTGYVSWKPADLHSYKPDNETELQFASPRSWTAVSNLLNMYVFDENNRILLSRINANLGISVGHSFIAFCKYSKESINPQDILSGVSVPEIKSKEVLFITISSVVKLVGDEIIKDFNTTGECSKNSMYITANMLNWLLGLPSKEEAIMGFKDFFNYEPSKIGKVLLSAEFLQLCPKLVAFSNQNKEIFS